MYFYSLNEMTEVSLYGYMVIGLLLSKSLRTTQCSTDC